MSSGHNYLPDGQLSPQLLRPRATGTSDLCTVQGSGEWRQIVYCALGGGRNTGEEKKLSELVERVTWE